MHLSFTRIGSGLCAVGLLSAASVLAAEADLRLVNAAARQDTETIRVLLNARVDVNTPQPDGATALHWAAHWSDLDTADLLLKARANVNAANDYGVTPLALACENANAGMVDRLLRAGANPNLAQTSGLTPLMIAARTGDLNVVTALVTRGADINVAVRKTGHTALMWALEQGHQNIVRLLVEHGADVRARTTTGFAPLLFAARSGDIEMAKVMIAAGADVNEPGVDGTHALPLAILNLQDQFALFLLERGADPNATLDGVPALHFAAGDVSVWIREWGHLRGVGPRSSTVKQVNSRERLTLVKALLGHGADANGRTTKSITWSPNNTLKGGAFNGYANGTGDLKGATPLWVAAWSLNEGGLQGGPEMPGSGSPDVIRALLAAGADFRLTTADKTTPLMVAAGLGRSGGAQARGEGRGRRSAVVEEGVRILVEAGADVNATNEAGFTALHGAAYRGANEVIEYLVKQDANINAQQFQGQTAFRIAQGSSHGGFSWLEFPATAKLLASLGADTSLGVDGQTLARRRDIGVDPGTSAPPR